MKKLFLTLALVVCWAVTAFAAGQINGLTLDNIEEKLIAFNKPYNGTWLPQLAKEDPTAAWYSLSPTTAVVAGHEAGAKKVNRIQFFVSKDERIPSEDGRRTRYIDDMMYAALAAASLCMPGFGKDQERVDALYDAATYSNQAILHGEKNVFTLRKYQFSAVIIDGIYTIWAEKK